MFTANEVQRIPIAVYESWMQLVAVQIGAQLVLVHHPTDVGFGRPVKLIGVDAIGEVLRDVLGHNLPALACRKELPPFVSIVVGKSPHETKADETDRLLAKTTTDIKQP